MDGMLKKFKLEASGIKDIATTLGSCIASDKITVEGLPVRYMYREEPDFETDSGWRFFSGTEDDEYINNSDNLMIYDINTIANYDQSILDFLENEVGSEFEKIDDLNFIKVI
jgi:hypothetical protein